MTNINDCFHFEHDPYRCSKFKLAPWNLGDKCDNCTSFIFINWKAINLPRKVKSKLYWKWHKAFK